MTCLLDLSYLLLAPTRTQSNQPLQPRTPEGGDRLFCPTLKAVGLLFGI